VTSGGWIALYAAIVGTASLGWQVWTHWVERRPKLRLEVTFTWLLPNEEAVEQVEHALASLFKQPWRLDADVLNVGRSAAHVGRLSFETCRKSDSVSHWTSRSWDLPWVLEPGEARTVFLTDDDAGEVQPDQTFVAVAVTTGGVHFRSESVNLGTPEGMGHGVLVAMNGPSFQKRVGDRPFFALTVEEFERDDPSA
jgi:hypothetical protein